MDNYARSPIDSGDEALDFTSTAKKNTEPPVLDLSCKKQEPSEQHDYRQPPSSCVLSPVSFEGLSRSPTIENTSQQQLHYSDHERKSPFEGRTFMVTPPSETDSPKKPKYEPIYNQINSATTPPTDLINRYPLMPMSLPMPSIAAVALPSLPISQSGVQTINPTQLPVSTTVTSAIPHEVTSPMASPDVGKKAPRPFKAYPKDPLSLTMGTAELMYDQNSNEAYSEFRKRMLDSVRRTNEGTNIKMRRVTKSPGLPTSTMDDKDAAYWERRRKNNEAAKRSRDARRAKEDEIAIRAAFLEQENMKLKYELVALRNETAKLRCMVYTN